MIRANLIVVAIAGALWSAPSTGVWAGGRSDGDDVGGGAQRLVVEALRRAHGSFAEDACFNGMHLSTAFRYFDVDPADPKKTKDYYMDKLQFLFYSPSHWKEGHEESICLPLLPAPPEGGFAPCAFGQWEAQGGPPRGRPDCITEMTVDSAQALAIAYKHGLPHDDAGADMILHRVKDHHSPFWRLSRGLREKTVWVARTADTCVFIDAATGRVLMKRDPCGLRLEMIWDDLDYDRRAPR